MKEKVNKLNLMAQNILNFMDQVLKLLTKNTMVAYLIIEAAKVEL